MASSGGGKKCCTPAPRARGTELAVLQPRRAGELVPSAVQNASSGAWEEGITVELPPALSNGFCRF